MCGRFGQFELPVKVLRDTFKLKKNPEFDPSYNVAPTEEALTVGENPERNGRSASYLRWGLIPFWSDGPEDFSSDLINARSETVHEKPAFRKQFHKQRCIVPVNGFYEWKQENGSKTPFWIYPSDRDYFGLAGLWDTWVDESASRSIQSFTILTKDANNKLNDIHHRMPVILDPNRYAGWLDHEKSDTDELLDLMNHGAIESVDYHSVSQAVNNPTYDQEECVEPKTPEK